MHKIIVVSILLLSNLFGKAQSWKYEVLKNDVDGRIYVASCIGWGGTYPYTKPRIVLNYFEEKAGLNLYLSDVGYTGCDNNKVTIVFDSKRKYFSFDVSTNKGRDALFINSMYGHYLTHGEMAVPLYVILHEISKSTKMYVRVENDCHSYDFSFSLSGSSAAIENVMSKGYLKNEVDSTSKNLAEAVEKFNSSIVVRNPEVEMEVKSIVNEVLANNHSLTYRAKLRVKNSISNLMNQEKINAPNVVEILVEPLDNGTYVPVIVWKEGEERRTRELDEVCLKKLHGGMYDQCEL